MSEKILLVDGHSIINRAFYGVTDLTNSEGLHTNAIFGFLNTLFKVLDEEKPDYLTVAFDVKAPTFRHKLYDAYKGTRKPMPEELHEQVPVLKDVLHAMGIQTMEKAGLEADDLLNQKGIVVVPDILANAGGVIVSYFEWVQNIQSVSWSEEHVNEQLKEILDNAFNALWTLSHEKRVPLRTGAYLIAVKRVIEAKKLRGIWP